MSFLMMGRDMRAMVPTELIFWGVMSLGVIVGFIIAYPANVWMVQRGLKHGLMTERAELAKHQGMHASPGHDRHEEKSHHDMSSDVTVPQLAAVAGFTTLMLLAGLVIPSFYVNLRLSAHDVGGAIMPRGMIMDFDTPAEAMRDMSAIHPRLAIRVTAADARGDQPLRPRIEGGVKVFDLTASVIRWHILPDVSVHAYAYNEQVPGPRLEVTEGDRVRLNFRNLLPESTTVHWHGLILPNEMDGPAKITQPPVPPGGTYTYEFDVAQHGSYFYHTHDHADRQQAFGLYGALIIRPKNPAQEAAADIEYVIQLQEWLKREWLTYPAMLMEGGLPNYFTINGKSYPSTDTVKMRVGQTLKLRIIGTNNNFIHPMHMHGGPFQVVARDGEVLPESARFLADTINVGPGQRYDVIWAARRPGKWLFHCHIPHHTANNNVEVKGGGGLTMVVEVSE
jgi:FtsP/CotA-like multicopper oxidase with cupredoxin domain